MLWCAKVVSVRFATYNIRHAQGIDFFIAPRRVARTIASTGAQVVGLQEVWRVPGFFDQTVEIADAIGMARAFSTAHRTGPLRMGNSVLTSGRIVSQRCIELPGRTEKRSCVLADLEVDGVALRFACVHLTLHRATRAKAIELLAEVLPVDEPLVLVGDFNATESELEPLRTMLTVPKTPPPAFPSFLPKSSIDHIAFSEHWRLEDELTVRSMASDHLPLVAELALR